MKEIIIKISDDDYSWLKQVSKGYTSYPCTLRLYEAVKNGILLDDIKAEIKKAPKRYPYNDNINNCLTEAEVLDIIDRKVNEVKGDKE